MGDVFLAILIAISNVVCFLLGKKFQRDETELARLRKIQKEVHNDATQPGKTSN